MTFLVDEEGEIKYIKPIKEVINGSGLTKQAVWVMSTMPKWKPGTKDGKNVSCYLNIPINFTIQNTVKKGNYFVRFDSNSNKSTYQDTSKSNHGPKIFTVVEQMPQFPGGDEMMFKFFSDNLQNPTHVYGKVYLSFVIDKEGNIKNIMPIGDNTRKETLVEESIRVMSLMPKWKPAKQNGKPVDVQYTLPINFLLK